MSDMRGAAAALLIAVGAALITAGPVMLARGKGGRDEIRRELADQKIAFPGADRLPARLARYAGTSVTTGPQARAFADMIGGNVLQATGGRTYSEIGDDLLAAGGRDEKLAALRQTAFMGQTLRASLMSAYQAWHLTALVMGLGVALMGIGAALIMTGVALASAA